MDSLAAPRTRLRGFALSPARFRRIAVAAAVMLLVVVATGATVRLTDSGLGCQHWPGCQPGDPFPKKGYHSYVEFSNRIVAFFTIVTTLAAWIAALLTPRLRRSTRVLAGAVFAGTLTQAPLGAITVHYDLNPWLVLSHLLLSLVVLAGGTIVALTAFGRPVGTLPGAARWASLLPLAALATLVVSGTIVTGSGPHPGGADVRRLGAFQDALWLHVRAAALVAVAFVVLVAWAWRERARVPWLPPASLAVLGLLLAQMVLGEVQYRTELPWWLVLLHVTVAAAVWGSSVALVASIWRSRAAPEIAT